MSSEQTYYVSEEAQALREKGLANRLAKEAVFDSKGHPSWPKNSDYHRVPFSVHQTVAMILFLNQHKG